MPEAEHLSGGAPMPETMYLDAEALKGRTIVFGGSCPSGFPKRLISAGTTCCFSPPQDRDTALYQFIAESGGLAFLFDGDEVHPDFYAVPQLDLFAVTAEGGWLGTLGGITGDAGCPICYVNQSRQVFRAAADLEDFLELLKQGLPWRTRLVPCPEVTLYPSREAAARALPFLEL